MLRLLLLVVFLSITVAANGPVYVVLWFDTEDYIEPASDDAALRLATDLRKLGVKATFKVVGEKARVLEKRGRQDVIEALRWHEIGYHTNFHSVPPTPAVYLKTMDYLTGADEFIRREMAGFNDVSRIFGVTPSCYGQPGSSWAPQTNRALRQLGVPMYLDEGSHVGVENHQPFWYGGLFYVFDMGPYVMRAALDKDDLDASQREFDSTAAKLSSQGGGVISIYYHPCEFATTEFWDGVNFSRGANPDASEWRRPKRRTPEDSERCYGVLNSYVKHALSNPAVRFVTGRQLMSKYQSQIPGAVNRQAIADHMAARQTFLVLNNTSLSAADMLLVLLGQEPRFVEGPVSEGKTTYKAGTIDRRRFEQAKSDTVSYIKTHTRLPATVWIGSETLSLEDFAATLAADRSSGDVSVRKGNPELRRHVTMEPQKTFGWVIHPEGFQAPELLDMARLQAWTLKPAVLK